MLQSPPTETRMYAVLDLPRETPFGTGSPADSQPFVPRPVELRPATPPPPMGTRRKLTLLAPVAMLAVLGAAGAAVAHQMAAPTVETESQALADPQPAAPTVAGTRPSAPRSVPLSRSASRGPGLTHHHGVVPTVARAAAPTTAPTSAPAPTPPATTNHAASHSADVAPAPTAKPSPAPTTSTTTATPTAKPTPTSSPTTQAPSPTPTQKQGPVRKLLDPVLQPVRGLLGQ